MTNTRRRYHVRLIVVNREVIELEASSHDEACALACRSYCEARESGMRWGGYNEAHDDIEEVCVEHIGAEGYPDGPPTVYGIASFSPPFGKLYHALRGLVLSASGRWRKLRHET